MLPFSYDRRMLVILRALHIGRMLEDGVGGREGGPDTSMV